jgi:hypothetical protein
VSSCLAPRQLWHRTNIPAESSTVRKQHLTSAPRKAGCWTNESGVEQGLPCVLYPKEESWADARTVIYAKIASTQYEDAEKFAAVAIKQMESKHGKPKEKIDKGKTGNGQSFFINEYPATKTYSQWERVAYVQLPKAVAYIVLSSRDEASYRKDAPALREVLKTFAYLEPKTETSAH